MIFNGKEHKEFFEKCVERTNMKNDTYHRAFFYALGICDETRKHINDIYDFNKMRMNFTVLFASWQTSTTRRICRLAFNMFNNFHYAAVLRDGECIVAEPDIDGNFAPDELFATSVAGYMLEAVKIRYPEYTNLSNNFSDEKE